MAFHNIRFPLLISYGSRGGPGYNTNVTELDTGDEERVGRWSMPKYRFDAVEGIKSPDQMTELVWFYQARQGALHSFKYFDHRDFTTAPDGTSDPGDQDVTLGVGDGSTTQFQLVKVYADAGGSRTRLLEKIIHAETLGNPVNRTFTVVVSVDDVPTPAGWSVDVQTGIITFTAAPTIGQVIKAGCAFDVPVRFGEDLDALMAPAFRDFGTETLENVPLVEERSQVLINEELNFGGSVFLGTLQANTLLSQLNGLLQTYVSNLSLVLELPDETNLPFGGPYFQLINMGGVGSTALWNFGQTTLVQTMTPDILYSVYLGMGSIGERLWVVR